MSRSCESCKACCITMDVHSIKKPAGRACQHLCSTGCMVYERRPGDCREFMCDWLMDEDMPASMRPDRTGAVIWRDILSDGAGDMVGCHRVTIMPRSHLDPRVKRWAQKQSYHHPVIVSDGRHLYAYLAGRKTVKWGMKDRMGFVRRNGKITGVQLQRGAAA